jgi:hypothetical protein
MSKSEQLLYLVAASAGAKCHPVYALIVDEAPTII